MYNETLHYTGNSMLGVFQPGDAIVTCPVDFADIQVGDIVIFLAPPAYKMPTVHRVIEKNASRLQTQGDNNLSADPYQLECTTKFRLAIKLVRQNVEFELSRGPAGYAEFCRHHRMVYWRNWKNRAVRLMQKTAPLRCFAPALADLKLNVFHKSDTPKQALLYYHDTVVAIYNFSRKTWQLQDKWGWYFPVKKLNRNFKAD